MNLLKISRAVIHGLSALALLIGVIFLIMGIVGPQWLVVPDKDNRHEHGLWQNCQQNPNSHKMYCSIDDESTKKLKDQGEHSHLKKPFEKKTLVLMGVAAGVSSVALILALATSCADCLKYRPVLRYAGIAWVIFHLFATILAICAVVIFGYNAYLTDNRHSFINGTKREQNLGRDYWYAVYGTIIIGVSSVFSIVSVVLMFLLVKGPYVYLRVPRDKQRQPMTQV